MIKQIEIAMTRFYEDTGFFFGKTVEGENIVGEAIIQPTGTVNVDGDYVNHPQYGRQFKIKHIIYGDLAELVSVLLRSGFLLGIREHKAIDMAKKLGARCFEVLDGCVDRPGQLIPWDGGKVEPEKILMSVKGIGPVVMRDLLASWQERRGLASLSLLAIRVDLKPRQFRRAIAMFGPIELERIIMENAYSLTKVSGITWETADHIALMEWEGKKAVDRNSIERLGAGMREALRQLTFMGGHMVYPITEVYQLAHQYLDPINVQLWATIKPQLKELGLVYHEEEKLLGTKESDDIETRIANKLIGLMHTKRVFEFDHSDAQLQRFASLPLGDEHLAAIHMALENNVSIVTGGPGTGKTTSVLNTLLNVLDNYRVTYKLVAPTGKAAARMTEATNREAGTIHRVFRIWDPEEMVTLQEKYLFIDEMSMEDADAFDKLLQCVPPGSAIVMIGDAYQLPPVGAGEPLHQMIDAGIPHVTLTQIYRQGADSGIAMAAAAIKEGRIPGTMGNFRYFEAKTEDEIYLELQRSLQELNHKYGIVFDDQQTLTPVNKGNLGQVALNGRLQKEFNPRPEYWKAGEFMMGDRVMHIKNNYDLDVMNGMTGIVVETASAKDANDPWAEIPKWKVAVEYPVRGRVEYDDDALTQLKLAYACTVHKVQGSEFPAVIAIFFPTAPMFYMRPVPYTGITRAKQQCVVLSIGNSFAKFIQGRERDIRYSMLSIYLKALL